MAFRLKMRRSPALVTIFIKVSDINAVSSNVWNEFEGFQRSLSEKLSKMNMQSITDVGGNDAHYTNVPLTSSLNSNRKPIIDNRDSNLNAGNNNMRTENQSYNFEDSNANNDKQIIRDEKRHTRVGIHNQDQDYRPNISNQQVRIMERRAKKGRITCDFGTYATYPKATASLFETQFSSIEDWGLESNTRSYTTATDYVKENGKLRLSVDSRSIWRFMPILFYGSYSFFNAFMGTLRLLAPLIFSRRALCIVYKILGDYMRGRYVRKTYTRVESVYIQYYETPATFRALCRTGSQLVVYFILYRAMGYLVGITHPPCRSEGRGLAFLCTLLWAGAVVGTGHAFATALALWGGPLRLQASTLYTRRRWTSVFTRPWHIFQWLQYVQNPEQWISMVSTPSLSFDPNPLIYPATWFPLRMLQMVAVAQVAATEPYNYLLGPLEDVDRVPKLMMHYLLQQSLCDEWYRVFVGEKRLGLGVGVAITHLFAMIFLMITSASMNGKVTLLMVPSFFAMIITGWMNTVIFLKQEPIRRGRI